MGAFALLLRVLTWWQAALCALAALLFNAVVLPRAGGRAIIRPADASRGYPFGILIYPVSVLLLILAFPARLDIAASAWGILAFGDGAATLVGRRWGRHRLAWNPDKSVEGLLAFVVAGGAAAVFFAWWTAPSVTPRPAMTFILAAPILAAVAAGLVETVAIALDDNISVPATAGAVLWLCSLVTADAWTGPSTSTPISTRSSRRGSTSPHEWNMTFAGGIDTHRVLPHGTPDEVRAEVRRVIGLLAPGGGYLLGAVHTVMRDVPPANVLAMVDAAVEFGRYPPRR
jgi:dolichol kinase